MNHIYEEFLEFLAHLTFMLFFIGLTIFVLTYILEVLASILLLYIFRPLIKRL